MPDDGYALSGLRSPVYQTVTQHVGPRKRSAAGQSVPDSVPVVVPDGGYALSGLRSPVYQTVTHPVGPRKRSAAGQAVPDSVPVIVPDGGYALSGLQSPVYQTVTQHRRSAQAQRRRASCTRLRSRRCAGWRLRLIRPTEPCISNGYSHRRPAQAQRRRASCTRPRSRRCAGWRLTSYPAYGALYIKRLSNTVGPPGKLYQTPFPSLCRMAANALSGLRSPVYQTVTQYRRPAQAQRRRASCTRLRSRRYAGWRLRLIRPTEPGISNGYPTP